MINGDKELIFIVKDKDGIGDYFILYEHEKKEFYNEYILYKKNSLLGKIIDFNVYSFDHNEGHVHSMNKIQIKKCYPYNIIRCLYDMFNIDRSMPYPSLLYGKYTITNIKNLIILKHLNLDNCEITSLNGIENLILIELDLYSNKIKNIEPLGQMETLECLDLSCNKIKDFTPLKHLKNLKILFLNGIHITDLNPLSQLSNLRELHITLNSKMRDLSPLTKMKNLQKLYFYNDGKISFLHKNPLKKQLIKLFHSLPNVESNFKD